MWIVKLALRRPYTFIVLALLILLLSPIVILRTPADIFPNINIPVISVGWTYSGLNPEELEGRVTTPYEKQLSSHVDNIQHIESTTYDGKAVIKIYLQPGASLDTANAQITAASQYLVRALPPGIQPPEIINFSASTVPVMQIGVSGKNMTEQELNDIATNIVRPQLITVPGAVLPSPYGGKQRQIDINMDQDEMQANGLAPGDLLDALSEENVVTPSGTIKIGQREYDVLANGSARTIEELANIPLKEVNGTTIYLRDVASVSDGFAVQTNIVRQDGRRGVLISIFKLGNASTLDVVKGVRNLLPRILSTLPPGLRLVPLADQSFFVRSAIQGVVREGLISAALTALLILIFLGSWRSTIIIAVSIPLSILASVIALSMLGETINTMTLGGLALAVGLLVDDATVTIENIERYLKMDYSLHAAILEGAAQISLPALVSTLCICIVFLPMFFLNGTARFLFAPMAEAVGFAMLASYLLSRTLVPTLAMYLLRETVIRESAPLGIFHRMQRSFECRFARVRSRYHSLLEKLVIRRELFVFCFLLLCLLESALLPLLGENFFPEIDSGQFILHVRGASGMRIEEMAKLCDMVEDQIRARVQPGEIDNILDNIGLPYSTANTQRLSNGTVGQFDADIEVSLKQRHNPTADYVRLLRHDLPREFPDATFYFLPADITTQILNFSIPAPMDIEIDSDDINVSKQVANNLLEQLRQVPGLVDLRIQQPFDYPTLKVDVDRTKALQGGYSERDVTSSLLNSLSGSFQITPMFFLNWSNHVNYNIVAQTPQYRMDSKQDLENIPIRHSGSPVNPHSLAESNAILSDLATVTRGREMAVVNHYNVRRVVDIFGAVQDADLGAVSGSVESVLRKNKRLLPRGTFITLRGQVETMRNSYLGLAGGLLFSIVLVYLLIVVNFQNWSDPLIIISALPAALAGIVVFLFLTHTTLSVPALMGAIMCMGVATANSILVVSFANEQLAAHGDAVRAAIDAGATRFRPVLMTALAMIVGMVPMALGVGAAGEENAPLGRAVIGGLLCATVATLIFVPCIFALIHGPKSRRSYSEKADTSIRVQ
jgi:CzcA family heavy metal efflux pump